MKASPISASYNVDMAKELGLPAAALLNKLMYLQQYTRRGDGFCWRTSEELTNELGIGPKQLRNAVSILERHGIIETKNTYIVGTHTKCKHYRIIDPEIAKSLKSDCAERDKSECAERDKSVISNQTLEVKHKKGVGSAKRFNPPTVEEIAAYSTESNNPIDPDAFYDFYASKGWKVGSSPMKDWKAAVRQWHRRDVKEGKEYVPPKTPEQQKKSEEMEIAEYWMAHPADAIRQGIDLAKYKRIVEGK